MPEFNPREYPNATNLIRRNVETIRDSVLSDPDNPPTPEIRKTVEAIAELATLLLTDIHMIATRRID